MLTPVREFLNFLEDKGYSSETIYNYKRDLQTFSAFLSESKTPFAMMDKTTIEKYKVYLTSHERRTVNKRLVNAELRDYSINRMLSSLRAFLRYLIAMDLPTPLPPEAVKLVKTERKHPQVAELNELVKLIAAPSSLEKDKSVAYRNRAMLEVLFATGMRISELVSLNRAQIDGTGRIFITDKGKKQRFVYLTPRAIKHVAAYLNLRRDNLAALFIPYRGENAAKSSNLPARVKPNTHIHSAFTTVFLLSDFGRGIFLIFLAA